MDHDSVVIQTPEYVEIEYELAGLGSRFVACMLDSLVQTAISVVIAILMLYVLQGEVSLGAQGTPVDLFIYVVIGLLGLLLSVGYWVASEMLTGGRSIGKMAAGLRVIRDDGTAISFWDSLLRNLLRTV
ncbi:MAG TPA: RDD family protein, partial [Armatimonadetes bacterium]|nr:RDD family protein [Armatimonadota bacterium]